MISKIFGKLKAVAIFVIYPKYERRWKFQCLKYIICIRQCHSFTVRLFFFGTKIRKCWKTEHSHLQLITINVVVGQKITRVSKVSLVQFTRVQFSWHFPQSTLSRELVHGRTTYIIVCILSQSLNKNCILRFSNTFVALDLLYPSNTVPKIYAVSKLELIFRIIFLKVNAIQNLGIFWILEK